MHGTGNYIWADGKAYNGQWKNNMMDGKGTFTWPDGRRYEGQFAEDRKHGTGIYYWSDGRKYSGEWKDGKQHGVGEYTSVSTDDSSPGSTKTGYWEKGKRIKWITKTKVTKKID